jgi:hypothetical protein
VLLHGNRGISGSTQANQFQTADAGVVSINFTLLEGWNGTLGGTGNFSADPSFVNPLGPDGIAGTGDEDMRIATGSPCIDAGNNNALPAGLLVDLAAAPRRVDDPSTVDTGLGTPPLVDIGAYEFQGTTSGIIATPGTGTDTLVRVWPNPSSSITEIGFSLPLGGAVRVAVYDVTGRAIAQPFAGTLPAGEHRVLWDGRNDTGTVVAPGVYHVRVESPADGAAGRRRESVRIIIDR